MILTPIDTLKTTLQAQGARGTSLLRQRVKTNGIGSLWWGAFATAAATFVGNYPWFATVSASHPLHPISANPTRSIISSVNCCRPFLILTNNSTTSFPNCSRNHPVTPWSYGCSAWPSSAFARPSSRTRCPTRCASSRRIARSTTPRSRTRKPPASSSSRTASWGCSGAA